MEIDFSRSSVPNELQLRLEAAGFIRSDNFPPRDDIIRWNLIQFQFDFNDAILNSLINAVHPASNQHHMPSLYIPSITYLTETFAHGFNFEFHFPTGQLNKFKYHLIVIFHILIFISGIICTSIALTGNVYNILIIILF